MFALRCCAVAILCTACGPSRPARNPATGLAEGAAIGWYVSQGMWGTEELTVFRDGLVTYSFEPVGPKLGRNDETRATPEELAAIEKAMVEHDFCDLESDRLGIPDEGKPTLAVRLGAIDCQVTLWDGEWRKNEDAAAVLAALKPVFARVNATPP